MQNPRASWRRVPAWLAESARAHALRFEHPLAPGHDGAVDARMLLAFLLVAIGLFLALRAALASADATVLPLARTGFVLALLAAFPVAQRALVRAPFATVGLRGWTQWSRRERLYLLQVRAAN